MDLFGSCLHSRIFIVLNIFLANIGSDNATWLHKVRNNKLWNKILVTSCSAAGPMDEPHLVLGMPKSSAMQKPAIFASIVYSSKVLRKHIVKLKTMVACTKTSGHSITLINGGGG